MEHPLALGRVVTRAFALPSTRAQVALILVSLVCLLAAAALARRPDVVEVVYAAHVGPALVTLLTTASGRIRWSLSEVMVVAMGVIWLAPMVRDVGRARRGEAAPLELVVSHGLRTATLLSVSGAAFYLGWGINYARPELVTRLGWSDVAAGPRTQAAATSELARLSKLLVDAANEQYLSAAGTRDLGAPSGPGDLHTVDLGLDAGYRRVADVLDLPVSFARSRGRAKPALASPALTRIGVVGYYFPWTGEATFNRMTPGFQLPLAIAHEKAHQRGVAGEDEANFFGYLAAVLGDDAYGRYAGLLFAQRQLLTELQAIDEETTRVLLARRIPGVQRDIDAARAFWQRYEGPAREAQQEFNDAYLSLHGVKDGIASYGRSAQLIVVYSRTNSGSPIAVAPDD